MNEYIHNTEYGVVKIEEFFPPYSVELIDRITGLVSDNSRKTYGENYAMGDNENTASLGYLLRNNILRSVYVGYINEEFQFFLSTRIAEDTGMFLVLVRTFSKIAKIKKPIHTAYILRLQMDLAISLGYTQCSFTMNVGTRDGLVELVKRRYLDYKHSPNSVKSAALSNMQLFQYMGVGTVNFCEQHIFTANLI